MPANTNPIFPDTPKASWGTIATANTAKDGTGTVVTLFTAGADGSRIDKIIVMPLGTNIKTALRLFLNNGSANGTPANNSLIRDISIPAVTNDEDDAVGPQEIPLDLPIPAGYKINATIGTTIASGLALTAVGGDY